ncbi:hypothetical protein GJV85_06400 [Sulfurimonas aquatica]|uniref:Uncharacterized protein n=1 Tax=Sulfurimonas aquatica TaxID=2672570 RepID=A0A975GCX3_9BACT|nr:hypothetical protein [Sulfurimonas aquatica]QSZ41753.1 hypothetical protein GJV85_06400 [Sulfurimonas aquatica]
MSNSNREIQLRKTCQLYAYVLESLGEEVPYHIEECADSYEYPVECTKELADILKNFDSDMFENIVNKDSDVARDLAQWWEMYQIYVPLEN